jgi:hypothetical protein
MKQTRFLPTNKQTRYRPPALCRLSLHYRNRRSSNLRLKDVSYTDPPHRSIGEVADEAGRWESERNESLFVSLLSLTKKIYNITSCAWLPASVCQCFNQLTNFHQIWYERSATGRYCNLVPSSVPYVLQSVIEKWQLLKTEPWTYTGQCIKQDASFSKVTHVKNFRSPLNWNNRHNILYKIHLLMNSVSDIFIILYL